MTDLELAPPLRVSLRLLIGSEVFGVEVFSRAERRSSLTDRPLWAALHELERQTRAAALERLAPEVHAFNRSNRAGQLAGKASGNGMSALPRALQMRSVVTGTKPFMPHFKRLAAHFAGTERAPFFDYVVAHELAIAEAGRRALAREDRPGRGVEVLLGAIPG